MPVTLSLRCAVNSKVLTKAPNVPHSPAASHTRLISLSLRMRARAFLVWFRRMPRTIGDT